MKQIWKEIGFSALMGLVLPALILGIAVLLVSEEGETASDGDAAQPGVTQVEPVQNPITVLTDEGAVETMALEEYLVGVVLAEMPVSFEAEAQKAQAVVARTFTLRSENSGKHDTAAVCMNSGCCQAYLAPEDYLDQGGTQEGIDRMRSAVDSTVGQVLTYQGELIEATYFSCSGGSTEDAVAVWGTDVPYLQAVDSPGEENAAHYTDSVTFTAQEFLSALELELEGKPESWLGSITYTSGGGVNTMTIGGKQFKGTQLRKALGLRSTAFTITAEGNAITITTRGYGHRVGMSQYGADAMAVSGSTYDEILSHYYQGTILTDWDN